MLFTQSSISLKIHTEMDIKLENIATIVHNQTTHGQSQWLVDFHLVFFSENFRCLVLAMVMEVWKKTQRNICIGLAAKFVKTNSKSGST